LSFVPVCCFVGFVLLSTLFVVGIAACGICITTFAIIMLATSILFPILLFTLFLSVLILSFLITLFLLNRLYVHLVAANTSPEGDLEPSYDNVSSGLKHWVEETTGRVDILASISLASAQNAAHAAMDRLGVVQSQAYAQSGKEPAPQPVESVPLGPLPSRSALYDGDRRFSVGESCLSGTRTGDLQTFEDTMSVEVKTEGDEEQTPKAKERGVGPSWLPTSLRAPTHDAQKSGT